MPEKHAPRFVRPAAAVCAVATLLVVAAQFAGPRAAAQSGGDYLPLEVGNRWELKSRTAPDPMILEVVGRDGNAYVVRWVNPWIKSTFRFVKEGPEVHMTGLDMGNGMAPIPPDTIYWRFDRNRGDRWDSAVGTQRISARGDRVNTPSGNYDNAIEVETRDKQGQSMFWTFAPGVGLVRFGQGRDAWLLQSFGRGAVTSTDRRSRTPSRPMADPPRTPASPGDARLLIGLDANPWSGANETRALQEAFDAGMTIVHLVPTWSEVEKNPGKFNFNQIDARAAFAASKGLPVALNIRIVDTNNKSLPKDISKLAFDDEKVVARLRAVIRAIGDRVKARVRVVAIGNEIDAYFGGHRNEIDAYTRLVRSVRDTVREEFPDALFTVNFTFGGVSQLDRYRGLADMFDAYSFTYYPLNPDFTMRQPDVVGGDFDRMIQAADGKPVYIQEIGYPSSDLTKSSLDKQAEFVERSFDALRRHRTRLVGATFLFMSDLPKALVDMLGGYYGSQNKAFKAYLETLGLRDGKGNPKPAWDVYRREALAIKQAR